MSYNPYSPTQKNESLHLTTPGGHEVLGEWDRDELSLLHAKVINHYTGVISQLDTKASDALARALKAKKVYEDALAEAREVETTLKRFKNLSYTLGEDHPALEPYVSQASHQKTLARDMFVRAGHYHEEAMKAIDRFANTGL